MQKCFEIEQGVPEIWGFKRFEMILLGETKKRKTCQCVWLVYSKAALHLKPPSDVLKGDEG